MRKLAAILFADIQGYTALMQKDETQAAILLKRFKKLITHEVESRNGHIVNYYGDGVLCTFDTPLQALQGAMAFQKAFQTDPIVPVRVGIHMGTIVIEEGNAYSDSINIASRIESLGIPGSILLSKRVRDELKNQSDFHMHSLGKFEFKNVEESIEAFAISNPGFVVPNKEDLKGKLKLPNETVHLSWFTLTFIALILFGIVVSVIFYNGNQKNGFKEDSGSAIQRLAVLPFSNLREDPDSDFLGLALADEIIGDLSYIKHMLIRPSSAIRKYTKTVVDAPTAGSELNVDYILVGNYMKEGGVIRMNVELVGVKSNELVWREEIEEEYQNAFQLQDIVSEKVLQGLQVKFSAEESRRRKADISDDPLGYEYYLRALAQPYTQQGNRVAVDLLYKSLELDSLFAPAWSELGIRKKRLAAFTLGEGHQINEAEQILEKAINLNGDLMSALANLVAIYVETGRINKSVETARKVLAINPNSAEIHFVLGYVYRYAGFLEEAEKEEEVALKLDPDNPRLRSRGMTQMYLGKYEEALERFNQNNENPFNLAWQGQIYLRIGNKDRALSLFNKVIEMDQEGVGIWVTSMKSYLEGQSEIGYQALQKIEKNLVDGEQIYNMANLYGLLGYKENCIQNLRLAVDRGFFSYPVILKDDFLDSVRTEQEFKEILEEARRKHLAFGNQYF